MGRHGGKEELEGSILQSISRGPPCLLGDGKSPKQNVGMEQPRKNLGQRASAGRNVCLGRRLTGTGGGENGPGKKNAPSRAAYVHNARSQRIRRRGEARGSLGRPRQGGKRAQEENQGANLTLQ